MATAGGRASAKQRTLVLAPASGAPPRPDHTRAEKEIAAVGGHEERPVLRRAVVVPFQFRGYPVADLSVLFVVDAVNISNA
jgi:hypothetical protein